MPPFSLETALMTFWLMAQSEDCSHAGYMICDGEDCSQAGYMICDGAEEERMTQFKHQFKNLLLS